MPIKSGVHVVEDNTDQFLKSLEFLSKTAVLVGVPEEKADRDPSMAPEENTGITNATLAYIHDKGAPEANIPARPFMEPGIKNAKKDITKYMGQAAVYLLTAKQRQRGIKALNAAGMVAASSIKQKIEDGPFVPLMESTLYRRRTRKVAPRTGTKPLIDTAQLQRSITYVVRAR